MDDRRALPAPDGEGREGAWRHGLSPRAERVARAAVEAMLADEDEHGRLVPPPAATCDRAVAWLSRSTGHASVTLRRGFGFLSFCLQMLPVLVLGTPRRMTSLSLDDRVRYLAALETSRVGLLAMLLLAFKVPMAIVAFEEGEELRSTGFDRPTTTARRQLVWVRGDAEGDDGAAGGDGAREGAGA